MFLSLELNMDIGDFLRNLGLSQYEVTFRKNEIDVSVLPELTDQHLKDLDVALGARLKILRAIRKLAQSGRPGRSTREGTEPKPSAAERRQLTVMFCDLVGSTALSALLDPEDMSDLIRSFQHVVSMVAQRYDGYVAKWMGDGALIYFGYPLAHEDDAERAAHAGMGLLKSIVALRHARDHPLQVRAGIATGLVVVGELMGEGEARERGVVGDTPNLAARLQALAEPGSVLVADATRRLLGRKFELEALEPRAVKGFAAPVPVWRLIGEAHSLSRFEAGRSGDLTPFVDRMNELGFLADRWRVATEGHGQTVLLSGEPGIGKSRTLAALERQIEPDERRTIRFQCSPHRVSDAFYPIASQIWEMFGLTRCQTVEARRDRLEEMIGRFGLDTREIAPVVASLLSIPFEGRWKSIELAPNIRKERTIAALIDWYEALTKDVPLLALLEDVQWIDPTSVEVFGRMVDRLPKLRGLLVITFRPEFVAPWVGHPCVSTLSINRLGRGQATAIIDHVAGGRRLPPDVREQILAKTDGVPLFVEELTKTVIESGLVRQEGDAYILASALTPFAIPSTLHDSLMARLDRLGPAKEIAQIGAAIGREFSHRLLEAISPVRGSALQDKLRQLIAADLIHPRGEPPEVGYTFKHALVQDVAYGSLLKRRRQKIHGDIAQAILEDPEGYVDGAPAMIAHHYTEAGMAEPATKYWIKATELALSRSANAEAERYAQMGLTLTPKLGVGPTRASTKLTLTVARVNALLPLRGFTARETESALNQAKRLIDAGFGTDLERFSVLYTLCQIDYNSARNASALSLAQEIVNIAERQEDTVYLLVGYRLLGSVMITMGKLREALESLRKAEQYRDQTRDKLLSYRFGIDPGLAVLFYKIIALMCLGRIAEADQTCKQARNELSDHGHAATVAQGRRRDLDLGQPGLGDRSGYTAAPRARPSRIRAPSRPFWGLRTRGAGAG